MTRQISFGLPALLIAAALMLASCGGPGGSDQGSAESSDDMQGTDHGSGSTTSEMLMEDGEYSDERFTDAMAPHHQGAVDMAMIALQNAEYPELRQLAEGSSPPSRTR